MEIIKSGGKVELFDPKKLCNSIKNAGAPVKVADSICEMVSQKVKPGVTSSNIFRESLRHLVKEDLDIAVRYSLKRGINLLGPAGFLFEQYVEAILRSYGYKTRRNVMMKGKGVIHEIDVVAEKNGQTFLVEAKYRNEEGIRTHIDEMMYAESRVRDINNLDQNKKKNKQYIPWLITNTKFTETVIKYAKAYNLDITGWTYPKGKSLEDLIVQNKIYPVTVIPSMTKQALEEIAKRGMILAQDLLPYSAEDLALEFNINPYKAKAIFNEVQELVK
ncbi:MAG: restriction endonuclease [Candidatus Paceibacterota bacterium]